VLVIDAGDIVLDTGDCASFKAGEHDGHHLQNRGEATALMLEVGTRSCHVQKRRFANRQSAVLF
jgi:uncharacterized cupin superfamily protein